MVTGSGTPNAGTPFAPVTVERRDPGSADVETADGRMLKRDLNDCSVIDMASLPKAA